MALTRLLVVSDVARSTVWYRDVLGATVVREYGGTSVVLKFLGDWLLLVTGGGPTADKPGVTFAPPPDPATTSAQLVIRVPDCQGAYETLSARGFEQLGSELAGGSVRSEAVWADGAWSVVFARRLARTATLAIAALLLATVIADLALVLAIGADLIKGDWELGLIFAAVPAIGIAYALSLRRHPVTD